MGKSLQSAARLQELARTVSSARVQRLKRAQPRSLNRVATPLAAKSAAIKVESQPALLKIENLEGEQRRVPLAEVVADCTKRWFQDTLKEAKGGDRAMQVLVGQMYYSGYGVARNPGKGHAWIDKASISRNSVWKLRHEHPGYITSDSDS